VKGHITGPHCAKGTSGLPLLSTSAASKDIHTEGFPSGIRPLHAGNECKPSTVVTLTSTDEIPKASWTMSPVVYKECVEQASLLLPCLPSTPLALSSRSHRFKATFPTRKIVESRSQIIESIEEPREQTTHRKRIHHDIQPNP
jgi:hypothetical protein